MLIHLFQIIDDHLPKLHGPGHIGELLLKSPSFMSGYYGQEDATQLVSPQGWFCTGDLAYFDNDACLFIVGRTKDKLKFLSEAISPADVEYIINQHPGVKASCVVGVPDTYKGDLPMAYVVKSGVVPVTAHEIAMLVQGKSLGYFVTRT